MRSNDQLSRRRRVFGENEIGHVFVTFGSRGYEGVLEGMPAEFACFGGVGVGE